MSSQSKDEKTDLSQCLVDYIRSYHGRFLDKDEGGWYVVPNIVARRKASQALREDNNAEKRAAKRSRFLKKKAAMKCQQEQVQEKEQEEQQELDESQTQKDVKLISIWVPAKHLVVYEYLIPNFVGWLSESQRLDY